MSDERARESGLAMGGASAFIVFVWTATTRRVLVNPGSAANPPTRSDATPGSDSGEGDIHLAEWTVRTHIGKPGTRLQQTNSGGATVTSMDVSVPTATAPMTSLH